MSSGMDMAMLGDQAEGSITPVLRSSRFDACVASYSLMVEQCTVDDDTEIPHTVWAGYIGDLMKELGYSAPKGTMVFRDLERMGCIEIKETGTPHKMTQVVLQHPPTEDLFINHRDATYHFSRREAIDRAELEEQASTLERIQNLEETVETFLDVVRSHLEQHEEMEFHAKSQGT